ncbi:hypothetical protein GGF31_002209 [Allomyces arbusculus]|nr:hypothetical protein GGF31_002209 [Allomyces arbusculus]
MKLVQHKPPMLQWLGLWQISASNYGMTQVVASLPLITIHHLDVSGAMDVGDATAKALVQWWPLQLMTGMNLMQPMVQHRVMVDRDPPGDHVSIQMLQQLASALFARGIHE